MDQKGNKSEIKYKAMERGLQEEPVEYGVSMPFHQFTKQAASMGTRPMPLNVSIMHFFSKIQK